MKIKLYAPFEAEMHVEDLSCLKASPYILQPFDPRTIAFLDHLSRNILGDKSINKIPEIAALGFWLRKSQINGIIEENKPAPHKKQYLLAPLGRIFHICPGNVDTMFIYSMVIALLMGNRNILRISRRGEAPHIFQIFQHLNALMASEEYLLFRDYINVIGYDHEDKISEFLSLNANGRLIWGGDNTIATFRNFKMGPRTRDIVFADRISAMLLDAKAILDTEGSELENFWRLFYNDAYTFDQMGCSSPQIIYLLGSDTDSRNALKKISQGMTKFVSGKYPTDIFSLASLKLNRMVNDAIEGKIKSQNGDNFVKLLELNGTAEPQSLHGCGGGYFYYTFCASVSDLKMLTIPKIQTITYYGLSKEQKESLKSLAFGEGIDRIVALGHALNFDYLWDGYNLFQELSRKVYTEL